MSTLRVKICGIRSVESARSAALAGADLLGFNFAPISKRRISVAVAREAIAACRTCDVPPPPLWERRVNWPSGQECRSLGGGEGNAAVRRPPHFAGIFVNQPLGEVAAIAREARLDYIQLSGDEDPDYCRELLDTAGVPIIKAIRLARPEDAALAESYILRGASIVLADTPRAVAGAEWGGSGQSWRWEDAAGLAAVLPLLLAGGLTPENVVGAVTAVRPWGVDVASGVETEGQTDPEKVRLFIERANGRKT